MNLSKLAIEQHQFFIIIVILFIFSGMISFLQMPRSEDPLVTPAGSSVIVIYPGASPSDMEELVINPLEEAINELEDIKRLNSNAQDGLAVIGVEFEAGSDPDEKYSEVVQKVNSVRGELPENLLSVEISKWSITDVNILQLALVSEIASYRELEKEAERLKSGLEKVSGVKSVKIWACPQQEIRISLNLNKMAQYHIPLQMVLGSIKFANENIPGGNLDIGKKQFNIKTSGSYQSLEDIRHTIVTSAMGKIIYLKDIAQVDPTYEDQKYFARFNGYRAIFITANQKEGTNIFSVMDKIKKQLAGFEKELPATMKIQTVFDQSKSVSNRVSGFFGNLLQGLILVGLVMFLFFDWRASLIVMMVIPTSILIAISIIDWADYGLQQMTIAGLVLALGMLVDNAIVVTQNISRFKELGYGPIDAAIQGTGQISGAVINSTLTTVLAFIPMMMIGDMTGDFIRSMPVTVVVALLSSLFISLTLTPFLSSRFLKKKEEMEKGGLRRRLDIFIGTTYRARLLSAVNKPYRYLIGAAIALLISLGIFKLFIGVSFFPKAEKPQLIVNINTPEGTNLKATSALVDTVESILATYSEIKHFATNIGRGNPRIYYNVIPEHEKSNHAQILVELQEYHPRRFEKLINRLRSEFSPIPGAKIEVKEFEQGPPIEAPIAIHIIGNNLDSLRTMAHELEQIILSIEGTVNVVNPLRTSATDLHININRAKAGMLGVPLSDIDRAVRTFITGLPISTYRDAEGKEYPIVARLPILNRASFSDLEKIYVSSITGKQIPLKQLATIEFKSTPMEIDHHKMERNVTLTADVVGDFSVNEVTQNIIKKLDQFDWPKGYRYMVGGELESRQESFGGMLQAVIIAVLSIFAVLVLQFRSYRQPLIVFSAIPFALIGSVWALFITNNSFSFTAFVGLTSLVGIVVNNSIILVDYSNQLKAQGKKVKEAVVEAGQTRFIPIFLTTSTTIVGLLPLTLRGGSLWAPLGWTLIGGLMTSTILTLLIVPVLYTLLTHETN